MNKLLSLFVIAMASTACAEDWWEHMQLYQIYPRSFMDSNGDGIGDLKGKNCSVIEYKRVKKIFQIFMTK